MPNLGHTVGQESSAIILTFLFMLAQGTKKKKVP